MTFYRFSLLTTLLSYSSDNLDDLVDYTNVEFGKLCTNFRLNKLSLHSDKTKFLLITHNNSIVDSKHKIFINNNIPNENDPEQFFELQRVSNSDRIPAIKYLIYFNDSLSFKYHISYLWNKISKALYSLRSVKNILPPKSLKNLYYSLFHCHLVYAIEIWSSTSNAALYLLITKQKTAIRIIANKNYNDHTEPIFKELSILPLSDLITSSNLKFFHSYVFN